MTAQLSFYPSQDQAQKFDTTIRMRLADSLSYLSEFCAERFQVDQQKLKQALELVRTQPLLPEKVAAYYELVTAIENEDFNFAQSLFEEILATDPAPDTLQIIPFLDPENDITSARYLKQIDTNPSSPFNILPAKEADFASIKQLIHDTMDLLKYESPELFYEISALLKSIMLGSGPRGKEQLTFDGASAPGLWGAIVLNVIEPKDVVDMAQTLAHESGHNLLFGYCIDDQLVNNPEDELHASPLRIDPRPLDGIYHATFVLARMHYAAATIKESPRLSPKLRQKAQQEMSNREKAFYDGLSTLKQYAEYTDQGKDLMDAAESYMKASAHSSSKNG